MTNQDWTQDDARELAEFAGYECTQRDVEIRVNKKPNVDGYIWPVWHPWSLEAPQWQVYRLLDAVREKGLEEEFDFELSHMIYEGGDQLTAIDYASAPPEAICSSILSMEV